MSEEYKKPQKDALSTSQKTAKPLTTLSILQDSSQLPDSTPMEAAAVRTNTTQEVKEIGLRRKILEICKNLTGMDWKFNSKNATVFMLGNQQSIQAIFDQLTLLLKVVSKPKLGKESKNAGKVTKILKDSFTYENLSGAKGVSSDDSNVHMIQLHSTPKNSWRLYHALLSINNIPPAKQTDIAKITAIRESKEALIEVRFSFQCGEKIRIMSGRYTKKQLQTIASKPLFLIRVNFPDYQGELFIPTILIKTQLAIPRSQPIIEIKHPALSPYKNSIDFCQAILEGARNTITHDLYEEVFTATTLAEEEIIIFEVHRYQYAAFSQALAKKGWKSPTPSYDEISQRYIFKIEPMEAYQLFVLHLPQTSSQTDLLISPTQAGAGAGAGASFASNSQAGFFNITLPKAEQQAKSPQTLSAITPVKETARLS